MIQWEALDVPDFKLLRQITAFAATIPDDQINMATWWCEPRRGTGPGQGCLLGHWVKAGIGPASLQPVSFVSEIKSPILLEPLLTYHPVAEWRHYTLRYKAGNLEAFGKAAAGLLLQMRDWDLMTNFYPAGTNYDMHPPVASLVSRLRFFLNSVPPNAQSGDLPGPQVATDG